MAQLVELQDKKDEAKTNYAWTIRKIEEKRQMDQTEQKEEDSDLKELWGLTSHLYESHKSSNALNLTLTYLVEEKKYFK